MVIQKTVNAEESATMKAPAIIWIEPSAPNVALVPEPEITAPRIRNMLATMAAVLKRTICVLTAVPNMLEASFAPSDHPRNNPPDK